MKYKKFILDSFKKLDDGDKTGFVNNLSEDVVWIENKTDVYNGKLSVNNKLKELYASISNTNHTFLNVWEVDDTYVITADLSISTSERVYEEIPWTAIVKVKDGYMNKVEVFTDTTNILKKN